MPEISTEALIVAIQAIAADIHSLHEAVQNGEAEPEEYELLDRWQRVAENLEEAYSKVAVSTINLPPYEQLVSR
jgi:hypothetical protein